MSKQYPGGIINKTPVVPTSISAPGIWTLNQQAAAQATNSWPFIRDPQFNYVTMLLHGDGSAGPVANGMGAGASLTQTPFTFDASTNNFNVTINGDTKPNNFNPYQLGYYSNYFSVTAYLSTTGNATTAMSTGDFTWECWVFVPAATTYQTFIDTRSNPVVGTSDGLYFGLNTGTLTPIIFTTSLLASSSVNVTANAWNHVAITRSGTTLTFWVNGASGGTVTNSTNLSSQSVYVGGSTAPSVNLTGYLSNVRMVKGTAIYSTAFTPSRTPLTAISGTSLLACQANRFIDSSSNAFTFTVTGAPQVAYAQPFALPSSVSTYGSAYFDGSGDYLSVANNAAFDVSAGQDFTVEFWWRPDSLSPAFQEVLTKGDGLQIYTSSSTLNVALSSNNTSTYFVNTSVGALTANAWNHIALVRSGNIYYGFINGVRTTLVTTSSSMATGTDPLLVGVVKGVLYPTNGYISDVRFVKGTAVYVSAFTPPTTPLTAITNTSLLTTQFNGGANNSGFKDASQFNFPITRVGNTTQGAFTPYEANWSNYFGGAGNYLAGPSNAVFATGTNSFTIEGWVYLTGSTFGSIISTWNSTSGTTGFILGLTSSNYAQFSVGNAGGGASDDVLSASTIPLNTWTHIAGVRNGSTLTLYVNGVSAGAGTTSRTVGQQVPYIGAYYANTPSSNGLTGYISNARFTSSAVYTSAFTPSITPLTAITNTSLLTCQGNRFVDNSTNAFAITATGSPSVQSFSPFVPLVVYNPAVNGGSAYFDGTGDYLTTPTGQVPLTLGTSDFTIEMWAYPTTQVRGNPALFTSDPGAGLANAIMIQFAGTTGQTTLWVNNVNLTASSTTNFIRLNQWNHIAICRSGGSNYSFYINGVAVNNLATNSTSLTTNSWYLGYWTVADNAFTGYITDARIIKGTALYIGAFTPNTAPLTAVTGTSLLLNATNAGIFDNAVMNNLETVGNAQVSTSVKKYGTGSIALDGTGDWLLTQGSPNFNFGGDFTFECWVYIAGNSSAQPTGGTRPAALMTITNTSGLPTGSFFSLNGTTTTTGTGFGVFYYVGGTEYGANCTVSIPQNTWHHIAMCRSGTTVRLFLNGVSQTVTTFGSIGTISMNNQNYPVYIGASSFDTAQYGNRALNGYIDDLRITNGFARYVANFTPPDQAFPNG